MCTVLLPSGVNPIAVKKYITSYHLEVRDCPELFEHTVYLRVEMLSNYSEIKYGFNTDVVCENM
jgi:hypothetical protein